MASDASRMKVALKMAAAASKGRAKAGLAHNVDKLGHGVSHLQISDTRMGNAKAPVNPYSMHMQPGVTMSVHVEALRACMEVHMQDPNSPFWSSLVWAHCLLSTLPEVVPWLHFRVRYQTFIRTGDPGDHMMRFQMYGGPYDFVVHMLTMPEMLESWGRMPQDLYRIFTELARHPELVLYLPTPPLAQGNFPAAPSALAHSNRSIVRSAVNRSGNNHAI